MYKLICYKVVGIIVVLALILQACGGGAVREIPVRDFFRTPDKVNFKISPDGRYISYLSPYHNKMNLFIRKLGEERDTMVTDFTDYKVSDYSWTYGNNIIFTQFIERRGQKPKTGDSNKPLQDQVKMYALNVTTMKFRTLLIEDNALKTVQTKNRRYPEIITIASNKRDSVNADILRLDLRTGELKPYITNPGNVNSWYVDQDGVIRLAKASDGVDEYILFRGNEDLPWKTIIKNNFKNSINPIAFSGTKNYFYALSNVGRDKAALVEIDADNGKEVNTIFASDNADISEFTYSKSKHQVESVSWEASKQQTQFLNLDIAAIYADISEQIKGSKARIIDRDSLERKYIINTYADRDPGSYYLYELDTKKLTKIGESNPSIKSEELCEVKPISYKATDGTAIHGYLTIPQGKANTNLPVVVLPHGGPFGAANRWGYSAEVQFLANRGYAVFQVNFRGSGGYGKAFYHAGFKQVGGLIQQDLTDGVKWLISQKIANPKKIAIMGSGFGGFCALYGIANHPDLYNCAVAQSALINYFSYINDVPPWWKNKLDMMYEMVGDPNKDAAMFMDISPAFHADKIKTPIIIFQGGRDPRINISDLKQFVSRLIRQKVPVTFVFKENERTFSDETRMDMYAEIEKFLNNNMRVKP